MSVLFTSVRPLERAENLKAVYDAYDGDKQYVQRDYTHPIDGMHSGRYRLVVTDGLIDDTPGKYIWIGHGCGAGKTIGLQHPGVPFRASGIVTYAIASSVDMVEDVAGFLGIPESKVVPVGMPRTDAYFRMKQKKHAGTKHLYAPTFRSGSWLPDFNMLWRTLPEGHELTVKLHMVTGNKVESRWPNIKVASAHVPSTPYLVNTDTVITDYSSIMFDAMVLRKPVILFAKDKEAYLRQRGMYYEYPDAYSDYFAENERDLVELLTKAEWSDEAEAAREYFCGACDGHSTQRTIELIKECLCES